MRDATLSNRLSVAAEITRRARFGCEARFVRASKPEQVLYDAVQAASFVTNAAQRCAITLAVSRTREGEVDFRLNDGEWGTQFVRSIRSEFRLASAGTRNRCQCAHTDHERREIHEYEQHSTRDHLDVKE